MESKTKRKTPHESELKQVSRDKSAEADSAVDTTMDQVSTMDPVTGVLNKHNDEGHHDKSKEADENGGAQAVDALKDQLLRLAADFDNYRKRVTKERDDLKRFAIERLTLDILPVLDNFDRALLHAETDKSPVVVGIRMVAKQLLDVLDQYGVRTFSSIGSMFNPERHEAVSQVPMDDQKPGTVLEELQRGYTLHGKLLRPAKVTVAMLPTGRLTIDKDPTLS